MRRRLIRRPRKNPSHAGWAAFCWTILLVTLVRSLEAEPPGAVGGPKTVTVSVADERTGQPVSDFTYRIAIVTTDLHRSDEPGPWQSVQASQGDFQVQVPQSCQLRVTVRAGLLRFLGRRGNHQAVSDPQPRAKPANPNENHPRTDDPRTRA